MQLNHLVRATAILGALTLAGCSDGEAMQQAQMQAPQVSVAPVISQRITEWDEFTGRLEAPEQVSLRPRVSGYIESVAFIEGALINAGDTLFVIDQAPFKAEVQRLDGELQQAQSRLQLAKSEYARAHKLSSQSAISAEQVDQRRSQLQQAEAQLQSVKSALQLAELNLSYTEVKAPISGRVSRALITKGNYVTAGQSLLTSLVSTDKVYAYFDADEQTYLNYIKLAQHGERPDVREVAHPVFMELAGERDFPHHGVVDFMDNQINPTTGTIRARAVFDNADGNFLPGMFARIKLSGSGSFQGVLIEDRAIGTDLNHKFVLVLDEANHVQYRGIELGEKLAGLRIIKAGLQAHDKIVVNGLQRVRPGTPVNPQFVEMSDNDTLNKLQALQKRLDEHSEEVNMALATATAGLGLGD
ncbi:efflux RND transporter periplasmic adaptor subunit [Pseudoalteromonas fenneropenaei]|uniref:Efflux RND transporter periplasmic adaptor subunit n=1 Tax=Pseudoalteromonas fenneropenaei TaxID=1737459 RepID=A0ABV7CFS7_9GAMM